MDPARWIAIERGASILNIDADFNSDDDNNYYDPKSSSEEEIVLTCL